MLPPRGCKGRGCKGRAPAGQDSSRYGLQGRPGRERDIIYIYIYIYIPSTNEPTPKGYKMCPNPFTMVFIRDHLSVHCDGEAVVTTIYAIIYYTLYI